MGLPRSFKRAAEHIDLTHVGHAAAEWKLLNFSFAYELPLYHAVRGAASP